MGKPKGFFAKEVDEATARRIAYIIGENSAYGRALAEADVRRQSGEDVALVRAGATVLVVPRSDITNVVQQRESE